MIKNLKKVISTFAAVAILATSASAFAAFPDVDASASYAGSVDALTALGIVNGDENGKFNPDNTVTRAEFAKMVVESMGEGSAAASSTTTKFTDAANHWAAGYIEVGVGKGFINGYDDTTFGPDDQVTYAQAVKMLVAAIGYDAYASKQGGWPSGYLAYGSSLDIIKGVTGVTNDTALTRAQCAVLIYNTLKAPICKVNGYEENYKGELVPKYEEMDGTGKDWQTLLTTKHDAYVVRGRVTEVYKKDVTVDFKVEAAENFDGLWVGKANNADEEFKTETMNIGTTDAANMKFVYSEAIVQKDEDTSEYTLISITPYGAVKTVEFSATDLQTSFTSGSPLPISIDVKKEGTSKRTTYKMEYTGEGNNKVAAYKIYVNGELMDPAESDDADVIAGALAATNKRGTVTLIDETATGSTSTNGLYDRVMVDVYNQSQITDVVVDDEDVTIETGDFSLTWTPDDEDSDVTVDIIKDGEKIAYSDVKVDDIVLVRAEDMDDIENSEWVELIVSDKVVEGTVTGRSNKSNKYAVKIDGNDYEIFAQADYDAIEIGTSYTMWLDAMGFVCKVEEGEGSKTLGIVLSMYKKAGDDNATVRLVDGTGEIVEYEVKDAATAADIDEYVGVQSESEETVDTAPNYSDSDNKINKMKRATDVEKRVIKYTISGGKLKFDPAKQTGVVGNGNFEYKASSSKLGRYTVSNTATTVIDLESYLEGGSVEIFSAENFEDEGNYTAYVYDRNQTTGVCGFVVLTSGNSTIKAKSALAVVMSSGEYSNNEDGEECELITVARNGEEDIEVLLEKDDNRTLAEGTVIMYKVGSEGFVDNSDLKIVYAPENDYNAMFDSILDETNFTNAATAGLVDEIMDDDDNGTGKFTLDLPYAEQDEVEIYYGPVYKASTSVLELFVKQASDKSNVLTDTESFTLAGANIYKVNYNKEAGYGERVSKSSVTQDSSMFTAMFADNDKTEVAWDSMGTRKPAAAFVRVVDGIVTDVVYYTAR